MKKPLFYKFESDEDYEEIGVATSESDARKGVRHFVGSIDSSSTVESEETKKGYFVIIKDD